MNVWQIRDLFPEIKLLVERVGIDTPIGYHAPSDFEIKREKAIQSQVEAERIFILEKLRESKYFLEASLSISKEFLLFPIEFSNLLSDKLGYNHDKMSAVFNCRIFYDEFATEDQDDEMRDIALKTAENLMNRFKCNVSLFLYDSRYVVLKYKE